MASLPCNEDHAITEAVFAVVGLGQFTPDDRSSVKAAHPKWEALRVRHFACLHVSRGWQRSKMREGGTRLAGLEMHNPP